MKYNAYQRVEMLLDKGSFKEIESNGKATGYLAGEGRIDGRQVFVSAVVSEKIPENVFDGLQYHLNVLEKALENSAPVILILDQPGHQHSTERSSFPQDPAKLLVDKHGMGRWYALHAELSGKVPQICMVCERMGASMTFPITLCDVVVMLKDAGMSIGRPDVVEKMIGEKVSYEDLGGADMHATISGSVDKIVATEDEGFAFVRDYLSYFPNDNGENSSSFCNNEDKAKSIAGLIPDDANSVLDMEALVKSLVDSNQEGEELLLPIKESFAKEVFVGFARIEGRNSGVVANNSMCRGGVFFPGSCRKVARFVSVCDSFGIPIVFLADSAGFMIGSAVEQFGIIREASLMLQVIANTSVSKISVAVRRDYTAGVYAMAGPGMNSDSFIALPSAVISIYGKGVAERLKGDLEDNAELENLHDMEVTADDPEALLDRGLVDEIIEPEELRSRISLFLASGYAGSRASGKPVLLV